MCSHFRDEAQKMFDGVLWQAQKVRKKEHLKGWLGRQGTGPDFSAQREETFLSLTILQSLHVCVKGKRQNSVVLKIRVKSEAQVFHQSYKSTN